MPTTHRVMYEALEPEEYKRFCRNYQGQPSIDEKNTASDILQYVLASFLCQLPPEGASYWEKIEMRVRANA